MEKSDSSIQYMESETFRSMPQAVIDRLLSHQTRFTNMKMTEESIDDLVLKAATESLDLDLSGSQLTGEAPYFLLDSLSRNEYVNFVHVNLSSSSINSGGFSVLMDYFVYFNSLETLNVRDNDLPKDAGVAIAKILGANSPLKLLDASGNSLSDAGIAAIAGAFTADLSHMSATSTMGHPSEGPRRQISLLTLAVLDLSRNNFGDGGLLALCRGLTHFMKAMLARRGAEYDTLASQSGAFPPLVCLRVLKLSHNKCGEKAATCLAQFLENFYRPGYIPLEELSLGQNPLGHSGVLAILRAVQTQSQVQAVASVSALATSAPPYPSLARLNMAECGCGSLDVLEEAAQIIAGNNLQELDLSMSDEDAQHICSSPMFVDTIVSLADAVTRASRPVTSLQLGNLVDMTKKEVAGMLPGSTAFYALGVALDSFKSIKESLRVGSRRVVYHQRSNSPGNVSMSSRSVTALQLQQEDFEHLRKEHSTAFHELSDEISRIPNVELQTSLQSALENINNSQEAISPQKLDRTASSVVSAQSIAYTQPEITSLVENAVTSALAQARKDWEQEGRSQISGGGNGLEDQLQHVVSRVDILQEQVQSFDSKAFSFATTSQCEELNQLAVQLETRIARLESRLDHLELGTSRNHSETQTSLAEDKDVIARRFEHLLARMSALENSVEAEHETSLDLLDVLLMKKQKQPPSGHSSADPHSAGHQGAVKGGGGGGAHHSPHASRNGGGKKTNNVSRRSR